MQKVPFTFVITIHATVRLSAAELTLWGGEIAAAACRRNSDAGFLLEKRFPRWFGPGDVPAGSWGRHNGDMPPGDPQSAPGGRT